jgi:hypothetical protein
MGNIRGHQGHLCEGIDVYFKASAHYPSTIGPNHFQVAALYYKLGEAYIKLCQFNEAKYVQLKFLRHEITNSSSILSKSLQIYGDRVEDATQLARTYFKHSFVLRTPGNEAEMAENLQKAEAFLALLTSKHGKTVLGQFGLLHPQLVDLQGRERSRCLIFTVQ